MARATISNVKIRFNGNKTDKPNSFCIFFTTANWKYVPFKIEESCIGRHYLIATCDGGLDDYCYKKSKEWDIDKIEIYGTEADIRFRVVKEYKEETAQLMPGSYIKIEDISTYSSYFCITIGGRRCYLDPLTEIRINGLLLDLNKGNTTESAMKKLSKIFNHNTLKEISCISLTAMPVLGGAAEFVKEINLDVPEHLRIGTFGMFKLCASYPENYYIFKEEPSVRIHLNTGKLYFRNEETMKFTPYFGIKDMTPLEENLNRWLVNNPSLSGADFDGDTITTKNMEETTMNRKKSLGIKNIIFNPPATIIFWDDNTKTVVKCQESDVFDPEKGVAMAVMKRALGTNETDSNYLDKVRKYLDQYREEKIAKFPEFVAAIGQKLKDAQRRQLKNEAMDVRDVMLTSGATHWELETFDRFCKKYIADKEDKVDKKATNAKKE